MSAASGEDVSIGSAWRASIMANSARDPYWQAAVRREVMDHPQARAAIEDNCAKCHMPMERVTAAATGQLARVLVEPAGDGATALVSSLAQDGVSCSVCHQIRAENLGAPSSFTGGFVIGTIKAEAREIFGPFAVDSGRQSVMRSASAFVPTEATHLQRSEVCATCHTLYTEALGPAGQVVGKLPEQVPFLEWQHSEYRESRSCQDCHMPSVQGEAPISSILSEQRTGVSHHSFEGGNAFMLRLLNKHRDELRVTALPQELEAAARRTTQFLGAHSARIAIDFARVTGPDLEVSISVDNLSGHKLPTAYPSRRAWIYLEVRDGQGNVVFESGKLRPDGSIVGNDNDADPERYEPHYDRIVESDQVQIYESVMVDPADALTTGLLRAVRYVKDNRLLPRGFDKASAAADIAVQGWAMEDANFGGGTDRIRYAVRLSTKPSALTVRASLWYQSIGYRWVQNLQPYDAAETRRFVRYYEGEAAESAVRLTFDTRTLDVR